MATDDDELFGDEHVREYRATGGQRGFHWRGTTILLLTTKGRRSGEERTAPLIFREDDGRYVIVASKGGAPEHPTWFLNMEDNPADVRLQVLAEEFAARHHVASGEERARLWDAMCEVWPDYRSYQEKTDREIPIVVLERA